MFASTLDRNAPSGPRARSSAGSRSRLAAAHRRVRRAVLARRRLLAALCAVVAVVAAVRAASAPPVPQADVLVAAGDIPGGRVLGVGDLATVAMPADAVPSGAVTSAAAVAGRTLAGPVRQGEPLTDARLVAPGLLHGHPGRVAAPVRVADAQAVGLLRVGDRVDVIAAPGDGGPAAVLVPAAPVLAVPDGSAGGWEEASPGAGGLVVLAVDEAQALALASAAVTSVLSVTLTG